MAHYPSLARWEPREQNELPSIDTYRGYHAAGPIDLTRLVGLLELRLQLLQ